jgi:hypothetical protein
MRKARAFLLVLLLVLGKGGAALYAQENEDPPIESEWEIYAPEFYSRGDQTFVISLGLIFPTLFINQGTVIDHNFSPPVGGTASFSYNHFLNSHVSLGAEIGGMFNYTIGQNTVFIIPIGLRLGYQFVYRRFEFPFTLTAGIAPQRYLDMGYFGPFVKAGGAVYYRFNPDWSFGVNANWNLFPQWTEDSQNDVYGNIVDVTISARYHF